MSPLIPNTKQKSLTQIYTLEIKEKWEMKGMVMAMVDIVAIGGFEISVRRTRKKKRIEEQII